MVAVLEPEIDVHRPRLHQPAPLEPVSWRLEPRALGAEQWTGWGQTPASVDSSPRPTLRGLRCQLVVLDSKRRRRASVSVSFDSSVGSRPATSLFGRDATGSLRVVLQTQPQQGETHLDFTFKPADSVSPSALETLLRWFAEYRPSRAAGVWDVGSSTWLLGPDEIQTSAPEIATEYRNVLGALARIERRSGTALRMPALLDSEQVREIEITDRLLRGLKVRGTWRSGELNDDPQMRSALTSSEHGVRLRYLTDHHLQLAGERYSIGEVEQVLDQVQLSDGDAGEGPIRLVAGSRNGIEVSLVSVREQTNTDGSTSWVPAAMLEPFRGQWVAQSGTKLLASGTSRDEVIAAVRAQGVLSTVWRVPDEPSDGGASELMSA